MFYKTETETDSGSGKNRRGRRNTDLSQVKQAQRYSISLKLVGLSSTVKEQRKKIIINAAITYNEPSLKVYYHVNKVRFSRNGQ